MNIFPHSRFNKKNNRFAFVFYLLFVFQCFIQAQTINPDYKRIIYVDSSAVNGGDGSSWNSAVKELSDALIYAQNNPGMEIWVKKGTYYPQYTPKLGPFMDPEDVEYFGSTITDRDKTFHIPLKTKIYGGFSGIETSIEQRNITRNKTILSGDLGIIGDDTDNSYHVVLIAGSAEGVVIDGFTIQDGNADGEEGYPVNSQHIQQHGGGGIYMIYLFDAPVPMPASETILISNVHITNNKSTHAGGAGIYAEHVSFILNKAIVDYNNSSDGNGGGIKATNDCTTVYANSLIKKNSSKIGGGIYEDSGGKATLINVTVVDNTSESHGAGADIERCCSLKIYNSIFWGNKAEEQTEDNENLNTNTDQLFSTLVQGLDLSGINNSLDGTIESSDPNFDSNYYPTSTNVINRGDDSLYDKSIYGTTDLSGVPRIIETIDLGAYEIKGKIDAYFIESSITTCDPNPTIDLEIFIKNGVFFPFTIKYDGEGREETIVISNPSELKVINSGNGVDTYVYTLRVMPFASTQYRIISISEGAAEDENFAINSDINSMVEIKINAPFVDQIIGANEVCIDKTAEFTNSVPGGFWHTSDSNIASIDQNGILTGHQEGAVMVYYDIINDEGCKATANFYVSIKDCPPPVEIVVGITTSLTNICRGESTQLSIKIENGTAPYTITYKENQTVKRIENITATTHTLKVSPQATTTFELISIKDKDGNENDTLTDKTTVRVTSQPYVGHLSIPSVVCPGKLLQVEKPAISLGGSALVAEGWLLDGTPFNPETDPLGIQDNGKKLSYWVTNTCGTASSNETTVIVSDKGLKVQDIGYGCSTNVDLNMAVVSTVPGTSVEFYRHIDDTTPIENPTEVAVEEGITTFYAKLDIPLGCGTHEKLPFNVIITKSSQIITFNPLPIVSINTPDFDPGAFASSGLGIIYTSSNPEVATIVNGKIHIVGIGTTIITAYQPGNECFMPAEEVSRELTVTDFKSEELEPGIVINDQDWGDLNDSYIVCDNITSLLIKLSVPAGATVDKGLSFYVDVTEPGMKVVEFTVTSKDGSKFESFKIYIDKRVPFESIVKMRWNNTFAVINNPANNGGYDRFVGFKWFRNEQVVGNEQYYTVNNSTWEKLNPQDMYYVEVEMENGKSFRTCYWNGILDDFSVAVYPNPVQRGSVVYVEATMNEMTFNNANVEVYNLSGAFISRTKVTGRITEIPMNQEPGTYILKFVGDNEYVRSFKVIVKE